MTPIDLNEFKHSIELNVRFMDLDAMHHVNNARYLNFLEESRIAYSQEVLDMFNNLHDLNVVVARIEIDFLRPITFSEKVIVYTRVSKIGNKSFVFDSVICAKINDKVIPSAHALQTIVAFDPKTQKTISLPDTIKQKVADYEKTK